MKKYINGIIFAIIFMIFFVPNMVMAAANPNNSNMENGYIEPESLYLSSLEIQNYDFYPEFNKNTTTYYVTLPTDVNSLEVNAKAENENTNVKISGNTSIKRTESTIKIQLTKSGVTSKTYTINVTKQKDNGLKLESLSIEGAEITPQFSKTKYYYDVAVEQSGDIKPLNITATPNIAGAKVEILGNDSLVEGNNNVITILVKNGEDVTTYQLNVLVKKSGTIITTDGNSEFIKKFNKLKEKIRKFFEDENRKKAAIIAAVFVLVVIVIIIINSNIKKNKANKNRENMKKRV